MVEVHPKSYSLFYPQKKNSELLILTILEAILKHPNDLLSVRSPLRLLIILKLATDRNSTTQKRQNLAPNVPIQNIVSHSIFNKFPFSSQNQSYNLFAWRIANKAFHRSPETTFLAYFHVFAENHQPVYH